MKQFCQSRILKNFLILGIHVGQLVTETTEKFLHKFFIGKRHKIELFDVSMLSFYFLKFLNFYFLLIKYKPFFLFTTTLAFGNKLVFEFTEKSKHSCFTQIWLGGILTNTQVAQADLLDRSYLRYQKFITSSSYPDFVFIFNLNVDNQKILTEATRVGVPVLGFIDSSNSARGLDYFIIGNTRSSIILSFYLYIFFFLLNGINSYRSEQLKKYRIFTRNLLGLPYSFYLYKLFFYKKQALEMRLFLFYSFKFWVYRKWRYKKDLNLLYREYFMLEKLEHNPYFNMLERLQFFVSYFKFLFLKLNIVKCFQKIYGHGCIASARSLVLAKQSYLTRFLPKLLGLNFIYKSNLFGANFFFLLFFFKYNFRLTTNFLKLLRSKKPIVKFLNFFFFLPNSVLVGKQRVTKKKIISKNFQLLYLHFFILFIKKKKVKKKVMGFGPFKQRSLDNSLWKFQNFVG